VQNFYPEDIGEEEFESWDNPDKTSLYTIIKRNAKGELTAVPYSDAFKEQHSKAADLLRKAAELAEDAGLKKYLEMRRMPCLATIISQAIRMDGDEEIEY